MISLRSNCDFAFLSPSYIKRVEEKKTRNIKKKIHMKERRKEKKTTPLPVVVCEINVLLTSSSS